jgi:hypothetical protein
MDKQLYYYLCMFPPYSSPLIHLRLALSDNSFSTDLSTDFESCVAQFLQHFTHEPQTSPMCSPFDILNVVIK